MRGFSLIGLAIITSLWTAQARGGEYDAVALAADSRNLSLAVTGKIARVAVKDGQRVEAGQVLMELEDEEGKAILERTRLLAQSELELKAAQAKLELAQLEESRLAELIAKAAAAPFDYKRAQMNALVADLEVQLAKQNQQIARLQAQQYQARHDQYILKAPVGGVVEKVAYREGESIEANKPVLLLVAPELLWIEVSAPLADVEQLKLGAPAWIQSKSNPNQTGQGKVTQIRVAADPLSNRRTVRVEAPASQGLIPNVHVMVSFTAPAQPTASAGKEGRG